MDNTMNQEHPIEDVETALRAIARKISSDEFLSITRNVLDRGLNATYVLTIKKQNNGIFCGLDVDERIPRKRIIHFLKLK